MVSRKIYIGLSVLSSLGTGLAQNIITDDTYFYGQSPPVYPSPNITGTGAWAEAYAKAQVLVAQLSLEEKVNLTGGYSAGNGCSGSIPPIERLGFTGLCLADAAAGVRATDFVSGWPSGLHVGASWNKQLALERSAAMGREAKKKGVNTLLAPVVGPAFRLALGGRNWEGFAADPYLAGALVSETVTGLQNNNVMACVKHFVGNEQETYRLADGNISSVSSNIDDTTLHEFYSWPFQDALHAGAASVMCSYNRLNNSHGCQNSKLLNGVLKNELGFQGFVVSDWFALKAGHQAASAGLDVVMPNGLQYWGDNLTLSVTNGSLSESRVTDMATRILSSWYLLNQDVEIPTPGIGLPSSLMKPHEIVDARNASDRPTLLNSAIEGHVLVKNEGALPLHSPRVLYLAGYSARSPDQSTPSESNNGYTLGYASSEEMRVDYKTSFSGHPGDRRGPAIAANGTIIGGGGSGAATQAGISSPFDALLQRTTADGTFLFWDFLSSEPTADEAADACIVFGNVWSTESVDRPNLRDNYTDTLIESIAGTCANTIVVLHNAGVRIVDRWIDHPNITALIFAHLPGQLSGEALVSLLYGDDNFSGKLPYTVPHDESDYGDNLLEPSLPKGEYALFPQSDFVEGVYIDYRHFDRTGIEPRYPFGFGLSYTTFSFSSLQISVASNISQSAYPSGAIVEGGQTDLWNVLATVTVTVSNTGSVDGQEVVQLYLTIPGSNQPARQLRGFDKLSLKAGTSSTTTLSLTRRDLSIWDTVSQKWKLQTGTYTVSVGSSSRDLPLNGAFHVTTS